MAAVSTSRIARRVAPALVAVALGAALSACGSSSSASPTTTTTTTPMSTVSVGSLTALSASSKSATFQAVYTLTEAGKTSTITFSQSPPKYLFKLSSGVLSLNDGSHSYYCTSNKQCLQLSSQSPIQAQLSLFDGTVFQSTVNAYNVAAPLLKLLHVNLTFSTATFGGQASQCMKVEYTKNSTSATYCLSSTGVLTYLSAGGTTFTLTSYTTSPPASDFTVPAGYSTVTIPSVG